MSNRLGGESSAYLKSAAHQPVHWEPWGDRAFQRARAEDRPILLDIGAVWCHWCHVMDGESYEDPAVAEVLNREFVCVKVDRDERPDVDARYQRAVQAISGQGGWPLTAFLDAEGQVFFGGTYFPPDQNSYGRPGFRSTLVEIARRYREDRETVSRNAKELAGRLAQALDESGKGEAAEGTLVAGADQMARLFDVRYGGFGDAPKFPHPGACEFLLARWWDTREDWPREVVVKTLEGMARGGIRDHLAGGFHRYTVDGRWIVPHFEKMATDNAELLRAYCAAYAAFGTPVFRETAAGIVDWVFETLSDPDEPVFFASQDADTTFGDDGDYWTWTVAEARAALSDREFAVAARVFDIGERGEMHHHPAKNVLWWRLAPAEGERAILQAAITKLADARRLRKAPFVDRTPYTSWNAMLAGAFLQAGAALDRPTCNDFALAVLERLWKDGWRGNAGMSRVIGRAAPDGMLEDQVNAAAAFLDAFEATGNRAWLDRAIAVMEHVERAHGDPAGGYWDVANSDGTAYLAVRGKPAQDAPSPSGNGVAALVLARLAALTDDPGWRRRLDTQIRSFAGAASSLGLHGATLLRAIDWALHPVTRIEVTGPPGPGEACAMHLLSLQTYRPRRVVVRGAGDGPRATVCVGTTCSLPVDARSALAELLA
ncbi:MAG TPA: thioredoxin domain-containing protein [Gemmatimonadales bacterium]|nr:thioredoxin domain-containing protein [Gemmatimonadales bacterium]